MTFPYEDADLDRQLQDVSLPDGFLARLKKLGELSDAELDRAMVDVALPPGFEYRLRGTLRKRRPGASLNRMMLAASILIAVGVVYFGAMAVMMSGKQNVADKHDPADPLAMPGTTVQFKMADDNGTKKKVDVPNTNVVGSKEPGGKDPGSSESGSKDPIVKVNPAVKSPNTDVVKTPTKNVKPDVHDASPTVAPETFSAMHEIYGTPLTLQPELPQVSGLKPRGLAPPHVKGYDITFQLKNREQPFVSLAAAPSLKTSLVPIVTDSASFDVLRTAVRSGKLPPAESVRIEELLAAVDYQFAPPTNSPLALRTAAGPSPFGAGNVLLQVGIQAATIKPAKSAADCLLIALDASSNLQTPGRLARLRTALSDFARRQSKTDRTMVFEFSDRAELVANLRGPTDTASLTSLKLQAPNTRVDWTAGLQEIVKQAVELSKQMKTPPRIVILSAGPSEINSASGAKLDAALEKSAAAGIKVDVIDIDQEEPDVHPLLDRCARAGQGSKRKADSAEKLRWALSEIAADCSLVAADNVRLKVNFNPKAVLAYRLIGHEATAGGGLLSGPLSDEMRSNQTATALYEVVLKPDGESQLATAEVTWSPPGITQPKTLTQSIGRLQVANSLIEAPLSLQAACLSAELGEVLRNSHFAPSNAHSLRRVRELAAQANPRLLENPSIADLLDVVDKAVRLTPAAGRGTK